MFTLFTSFPYKIFEWFLKIPYMSKHIQKIRAIVVMFYHFQFPHDSRRLKPYSYIFLVHWIISTFKILSYEKLSRFNACFHFLCLRTLLNFGQYHLKACTHVLLINISISKGARRYCYFLNNHSHYRTKKIFFWYNLKLFMRELTKRIMTSP